MQEIKEQMIASLQEYGGKLFRHDPVRLAGYREGVAVVERELTAPITESSLLTDKDRILAESKSVIRQLLEMPRLPQLPSERSHLQGHYVAFRAAYAQIFARSLTEDLSRRLQREWQRETWPEWKISQLIRTLTQEQPSTRPERNKPRSPEKE